MYLYIKASAIACPHNKNRYLIGTHVAVATKTYLSNGKAFTPQVLYISSKLNPWGFKGEKKEVIMEFLTNTHSFGRYPYPGGYDLYPIESPVDTISLFSHHESFRKVSMYIWDIAKDVEKSFGTNFSFDEDEMFREAGVQRFKWKDWFTGPNRIPENGITSVSYLYSKEDRKVVEEPYYVIEKESGQYYGSSEKDGYLYHTASQFITEAEAVEVACKDEYCSNNGFQIIKSNDLRGKLRTLRIR